MEQNVKTLEALKDKLCNWKSYDETQLQELMKIAVIFAGNRKFNAIRLDY